MGKGDKLDSASLRKFVLGLFKFDKSYFLSFIFYIHIAVQGLALIFWFYMGARAGIGYFIVSILLYPVIFFYVRFAFEFITILFSINDNLLDIKKQLKK